jgi:hypothetical protein
MSTRSFLYGLWSLGVIGLFMTAGVYGWSPFADGGRARPHTGFYGPTHK